MWQIDPLHMVRVDNLARLRTSVSCSGRMRWLHVLREIMPQWQPHRAQSRDLQLETQSPVIPQEKTSDITRNFGMMGNRHPSLFLLWGPWKFLGVDTGRIHISKLRRETYAHLTMSRHPSFSAALVAACVCIRSNAEEAQITPMRPRTAVDHAQSRRNTCTMTSP